MRTFIVLCEQYERYGQGEIDMEIYHAKDLDDLALQIDEKLMNNECSPFEALEQMNGDGCNYYVIREIVDGEFTDEYILQ